MCKTNDPADEEVREKQSKAHKGENRFYLLLDLHRPELRGSNGCKRGEQMHSLLICPQHLEQQEI